MLKNLSRLIGILKARNDENLAELITISLKHAVLINMQFLLTDLYDKEVYSEKLTLLVICNEYPSKKLVNNQINFYTLYLGNVPTRFTKTYIFSLMLRFMV